MKTLARQDIARMVANHLPKEGFVNLGIGAPTAVADYLPKDSGVMLHSENGVLNIGPKPEKGKEDWDLINAGKSPITINPGGAFFDSSLAFSMMRGGHIDIAILGAFQVSERGDLANWSAGDEGASAPAVGGAIDLAVGAKAIWVLMDHVTRDGTARIVKECSLPLTAERVVSRIFTSMSIIDVTPAGLVVNAMMEGMSIEELQKHTLGALKPAPRVRTIKPDGGVVE